MAATTLPSPVPLDSPELTTSATLVEAARAQRVMLLHAVVLTEHSAAACTDLASLRDQLADLCTMVREYVGLEAFRDRARPAHDTDPPSSPASAPCDKCRASGFLSVAGDVATCPKCYGAGCLL